MSALSTPIIFSSVRGFLAQAFVDQIPIHINKADFFEKTCKEHNITLEKCFSNNLYSFEGQWNDFLSVESFLQKCIIEWCLNSQTSKCDSVKNDSIDVDQVEKRDGKWFSAESSNCVQSDSKLESVRTEVIPEITVSKENQCISSICENRDQHSSNDVCIDKGGLDHENEIYMDIQLSSRPPYGLFKHSGNTPVTVVMGTEESLIETICFESAGNEQVQFEHIVQPENLVEDFSTADDWKKIRSRKYEEKAQFKYFCTQCSFKSKRQSHLRKHSLLHERVCKLYSCDHCDFSTIRLGHLQRHVLQHSDLQLICPDCNYKTHSKSLLQKHQNLKHKLEKLLPAEEKPVLQCSECAYSTTKEKLFQRHQIVHTDSKNIRKGSKKYFECGKCSFKTTLKSNFARHSKNVHMKDRPFLCNVCGQGFKRSDTLSQHLVVHAGGDLTMNELQCPHCQKFYRSKTLLHEHMLVHSDIRSYLCEICGAAFKTRAVQRKHVRYVHSNSKLFPCNLCFKKFNSSFAVKRHMKLHEPKTAVDSTPKAPLKSTESSTAVSDQWESSVMTLPIPEDVQVLVVQQDDVQQGVIFNEGAIFVQDSAEIQMESTTDQSKTVNVPVLPVECILPEEIASQVCSTTNFSDQFSLQDGEVITLQFVQ